MKALRIVCICLVAIFADSIRADDFLDRVDEALTWNAFDGQVRSRLSGLLDLELYGMDLPPLGLIDTNHHFLVNPRLSLFLDTQVGRQVYFFVQTRVDRDFDPADVDVQVRLDEYAVRIDPSGRGYLDLELGKFATVVGNFVPRHLSWENAFVTSPLPYEGLTPISDMYAPRNLTYFASIIDPTENTYLPLIWGPSYATGASIFGKIERFSYAVEVKNSALASRPDSWDATEIGFENPTVSGRLGFSPNEAWNLGFSASDGSYLRPEAASTLPPGRSIGDYHQFLLGQDVSYSIHHLQFWAEFYEVRFQVPRVGDADTFSYYLEAKYKFTPQLFCALRWNQQLFGTVSDAVGRTARWGHDLWRVDASIAYRFTAHTQLKVQYSFEDETADSRNLRQLLAVQFTVRF